MFLRIFLVLASLGILFTAANYRPSATNDKDRVLLDMVLNGIQQNHYADIAIDDKFSERVYTLYLKNLDFGKRFFTQGDVEAFAMYKTKLDDQMQAGSYEFFELTASVYQKRQKQIEGWYQEILSKPFDFEKIEDLETNVDKREFAKDEAELKELWRKQLKFQVLTRLADKLEEQDKAEKGDDIKKKTAADFEVEARERVLKTHNDWYHRLNRQLNGSKKIIHIACVCVRRIERRQHIVFRQNSHGSPGSTDGCKPAAAGMHQHVIQPTEF